MSGPLSESPPEATRTTAPTSRTTAPRPEKGVARSGQGDQDKAEQGDGRSKDHQYGAHRANISTLTAADEGMLGRWRFSLPLSWRSAFPPVGWWLLPDHGCRNLHGEMGAELPQLLRRARILEQSPVNFECVKFAGTVAIDGVPDTVHEVTQLRVVVIRDHRARRPSLRLAGHTSEVTHGLASRRPQRTLSAVSGCAVWSTSPCCGGP